MKKVWKLISVTAIACIVGSGGVASAADSTILFAGGDVREKAYYPFLGLIHHFSGDILTDGFLVRVFGYHSNYEYSTTAVAGGKVDGKADGLDVMVGYQKVMESYAMRGYFGLDYEDHNLSPDNMVDSNRGADTGAKVQGEFETDFASPNYVSLIASYGTAKDRYWARLRGGHDFSGFVIGPEAILTGDKEFDEQRIGAFVLVRKILPAMLSVSAGYSDSGNARGGSSPYLTFEISRAF
jgi:hypothetical protein